MRLFVSVPLPAEQRAHLLQALAGSRTTDPDRWHLTLAFLGDDADPGAVVGSLAAVVRRHAPLTLTVAGSGTFPGVTWAGVTGDVAALTSLAADVSAALGLPPEPFRPHVTVARRGRAVLPAGYAGPAWTVGAVDLVRSTLGRAAEHLTLATLPLGAGPSTARRGQPLPPASSGGRRRTRPPAAGRAPHDGS